ncbi:MAG: hypothetical protein QG553_357 [Patescibacteria group bacterium]|nr:hypothetical protein [Patescibacteria group bacterium]
MAEPFVSPEYASSDGFEAASLAPVHQLHPPQEGDFDSGTHHFYQGDVKVGREDIIWTLELSENMAYDGLAIIVPGYSGIKGSSRKPRGAMADEGFATLSYTPARRGSSWYETATNPQLLHSKTIHQVGKAVFESTEIRNTAPNIQDRSLDKLLLLAHSMGGLGATEYGIFSPQSVDAIVKLAACGYGHPTLAEIIADVPKGAHLGLWHELIPSLLQGHIPINGRNAKDLVNYFMHLRAAIEGNSCLREDSREKVATIRDNGVFVAYQAYQHDILVRADPAVAEHVDYHEIMPDAGHLAPIRKAKQVAQRVSDIVLSR